MSEKDPIEELFRREVEETSFQDKPREVVWKKIENNLQKKTETPVKNFIQSVWFSAAVFALIAVPYFYFLIENINHTNGNINIVKKSVEKILIPEIQQNEVNADVESVVAESPILVKNDEKVILKHKTESNKIVRNDSQELKSYTTNEELILDSSTKPIAASANVDTILLAKAEDFSGVAIATTSTVDTILLAANKAVPVKETVALRSKSTSQDISPLSFQRNRFIIQDKVTRVSFEFIRKNNNRLIFQKGGIKLTLVRDKGQVKILTNTKDIKPEILSQIQTNKELIYNYYINFEASKNK
ncbi:hypothetical protein [Faecalibacter bovis]|uniref:FecR protein domain-containing protein n=1 Tax=Faecalibacter bovis TaxID=2898187 RepID=A0ABX7XFQ0_9FLAO|nr:hypothetical protein [Faecalibacter bovis]QTV06647.1 hypothetical protein J9309_04850 [Faecalibacter bovis]